MRPNGGTFLVFLNAFPYFQYHFHAKRNFIHLFQLKTFSFIHISFFFYSVLFVVYDELCENSKKSISKLADTAIVIAFFAYLLAGVFGYIAFYDVSIHGNIITNIFDSFMSYVLKFGFIICVLSGFPCNSIFKAYFFIIF